jgi:hypothetical protein
MTVDDFQAWAELTDLEIRNLLGEFDDERPTPT